MIAATLTPTMALARTSSTHGLHLKTIKPGDEGTFDLADPVHLKRRGVTLTRAIHHCRTTAARFRQNHRTHHVEHERLLIARKLKQIMRFFASIP